MNKGMFCECDRPCSECSELLPENVRWEDRGPAHHYLVLPGHQSDTDHIVEKRDGYYIVEAAEEKS